MIYTSGRPRGRRARCIAISRSSSAVMSNAIEMKLGRDDGITGQFPLFHCAGHVLLLSYLSVGGRMALLRGSIPWSAWKPSSRQAHRVCRPVADVSGDPRSSAPPGVRSFEPADLYLHHGADGPAAAGACDGRHVPKFRAEQRPDRNVSGDHDVAAGGPLERFGNYWGESLIVNETAIMDDNGNLLPRGEIGEFVHRGPTS